MEHRHAQEMKAEHKQSALSRLKTVRITAGGDALHASFGVLSSTLQPYESNNKFIEELVPGSLHLITFEKSSSGQMTLKFRDETYERTANAM